MAGCSRNVLQVCHSKSIQPISCDCIVQGQPRDNPKPIFYVSDGAPAYAPSFLSFGGHTAVVNGLHGIPSGHQTGEFYGYKSAFKVIGSAQGLTHMGRRVALNAGAYN